jgi:hypothetical protein
MNPESGSRRVYEDEIRDLLVADANGLAPDQLIGFDTPCSARPPGYGGYATMRSPGRGVVN